MEMGDREALYLSQVRTGSLALRICPGLLSCHFRTISSRSLPPIKRLAREDNFFQSKSKDKSRFQVNMYPEINTGENREEALKNKTKQIYLKNNIF